MKRIVFILFCFCVLLFSVACNKVTPAPTNPTTEPSPTAQQQEPEITPGKLEYEVSRPIDGLELNTNLAFAQLLTDVNYNGEYKISEEIIAPGAVKDISLIPAAPQDLVGKTVELAFGHDSESVYFYYFADVETGKERLAVIVQSKIPLLAILETDLGGADGLRERIVSAESFRATVLALANIDNLEPIYVQQACLADMDDYPYLPTEFVDVFGKTLIYGRFMGKVEPNAQNSATTLVHMRGNSVSSASEPLQNSLAVFERILNRFSLGEMLYLTVN